MSLSLKKQYSELSLRQALLGPAFSVHLREVSTLERVLLQRIQYGAIQPGAGEGVCIREASALQWCPHCGSSLYMRKYPFYPYQA